MLRNMYWILSSVLVIQAFGIQPDLRLLAQIRRTLPNTVKKTLVTSRFNNTTSALRACPTTTSVPLPNYITKKDFCRPYSVQVRAKDMRYSIHIPDIVIYIPKGFELTNTIIGDENHIYGPDYKYHRFNVYAVNSLNERTWSESFFIETFSSQIRQQYGMISPSYSMQKFFNGNIIEERIYPTQDGHHQWRIVEHDNRQLSGRRDVAAILFVKAQDYCSVFTYVVSVNNFPSLDGAVHHLKEFVRYNIVADA